MEYISTKESHQMLARLYQTFILWLEEPRLHDANLFLPALPPQYEANRLNQVFQGFAGPWLEFVDTEGVQYKLSCLSADWRNRLTRDKTLNQTNTDRLELIEFGNATKRIEQRLKRYDVPKDAPTLAKIQSTVPLISPTIIGDKAAFQQLVSSDLELLRQHTQIFSAKNANHSALDDIYVKLLPSLFTNASKVIKLTAECRSSLNPLHRCVAPAVLPIKINEKDRNEITFRRIEENRLEYKQLMIELLIPTPPNICVAAVHTENGITSLIKQYQKSTSDISKTQRLQDIGCSLFLYLTSLVTEETNFYPPAKHFLASCIDILGQEFVSRDPSQAETVLQLCLDNPLVCGMVSPHFVPNLCPDRIVDMYGQLIHVLQNQNVDLAFMLLTKFDFSLWLEQHRPSEKDKHRLVEILGSSLTVCGVDPSSKSQMVFGLYVNHLNALLKSFFPANLSVIVNMILQGSASQSLHVQVWETFLSVVFSSSPPTSGPFDTVTVESCNDIVLSTAQVKELLDMLGSYFMGARVTACQNNGEGSLYSQWAGYAFYIGLFLGGLVRNYTTKLIRGSDDISNPFDILNCMWSVYAPWILPMVGDNEALNTPWLEKNQEAVSYIAASLAITLEFIYQQFVDHSPDRAPGVLSLVLMYYLSMLCTKTTPAHAMTSYLQILHCLPWDTLHPDLQLVEAMAKVKEVAAPCCFSLVGYIMPLIKWETVNNYHLHHTPSDISSRMQTGIALLLIQCYVDPQVLKNDQMYQLLVRAETFNWSVMRMEGISCVSSWFLQLGDPACVLAERSSRLAIGLRLLKQLCGFTTYVPWLDALIPKRQMYIHLMTQQVCQLTYKEATDHRAINTALVNLMSEIEAVESAVPSAQGQAEESAGMLKSVCGLLNNSNPDGATLDMILATLTGWLQSSPQSILLAPCMKAASTSLASLSHMAVVLEACISSYFNGSDSSDQSAPVPNGWDFILSIFHIPELNQAGFVQEALVENAFLVLYAYLRYRVPFCETPGENYALLEEILDMIKTSTPSAENEMKILLWWHLLLQLLIKQDRMNPAPKFSAVNVVNRFIPYLDALGLERNQKGILGAIGFGQKSPLSKRMRLTAIVLSAFLQTQLIDQTTLRLGAHTPLPNTALPKELRTLRVAKSYADLYGQCDKAIVFMRDPTHSMNEAPAFISMMGLELYPDEICLKHIFL